MTTMTAVKAQLADDSRVKKEKNKLTRMFKHIPPGRRVTVGRLIENAAFMAVLLEDLRADIAANGYIETYNHGGGQNGTKRSVAADLYQVTVKNFGAITKQLHDLLPADYEQEDELMQFIKRNTRTRNSV